MAVAVPIILAVALATSLYGQVGRVWPNQQADQNEQAAKNEEKPSEDKTGNTDESSEESKSSGLKNAARKSARARPAESRGRRDGKMRRQE